ncbi:Fasciclin and related adhesion glycoprotein [Scheffersomyces amazonensis]|uniref:Fasciclin and related adhesion glycoprotein n=1 Tax=Scheffersomyces amazonensis TaxID=1078765 RepID=UPI00315CD08A
MKFSVKSLIATAALVTKTLAVNVACLVEGVEVAIVDLDTGVCPFTIPANLPVFFDFTSPEDFNVEFYYSVVGNARFFNDIVAAGRIINIPAIDLFGLPGAPLYQVHVQETPSVNSTAAIRKRLFKDDSELLKRDAASDFAASLESLDGTLVNSGAFQVVALSSSSSAPTSAPSTIPVSSGVETLPTGTVTTTLESTTLITITSCKDHLCTPTVVPATPALTTETINGEVTIYTTYCPLSGETETTTVESTTIITITSCKDNKCEETTVPATPALTTQTIEGVVTVFTTYCPVSGETTAAAATGTPAAPAAAGTSTETETLTKGAAATTGAAAGTPGAAAGTTGAPAPGVATTPVTVAAESTGAAATTGAISTYEGAAANFGASLLALAFIPLAYLL